MSFCIKKFLSLLPSVGDDEDEDGDGDFEVQMHVHVHVHALFVYLTLLASFFLPSHLSFKNMYINVMYSTYVVWYVPSAQRGTRSCQ